MANKANAAKREAGKKDCAKHTNAANVLNHPIDLNASITLTMDEIALFVNAVRTEEQGWEGLVAATEMKDCKGEHDAGKIAETILARAVRHAHVSRIYAKSIRPELSAFLHGNPSIA